MNTPCPEVGLLRSQTGTLHEDRGQDVKGRAMTGCNKHLDRHQERHVTEFTPDELCSLCFPKLSFRPGGE